MRFIFSDKLGGKIIILNWIFSFTVWLYWQNQPWMMILNWKELKST